MALQVVTNRVVWFCGSWGKIRVLGKNSPNRQGAIPARKAGVVRPVVPATSKNGCNMHRTNFGDSKPKSALACLFTSFLVALARSLL